MKWIVTTLWYLFPNTLFKPFIFQIIAKGINTAFECFLYTFTKNSWNWWRFFSYREKDKLVLKKLADSYCNQKQLLQIDLGYNSTANAELVSKERFLIIIQFTVKLSLNRNGSRGQLTQQNKYKYTTLCKS